MWQGGAIAAVVDWEEAAYGDPAVDVAYARLELHLLGLPAAAETFLQAYEAEAGSRVGGLGFWELAASARAMPDPAAWLREWVALGAAPCDERVVWRRLGRFIAEARARCLERS